METQDMHTTSGVT